MLSRCQLVLALVGVIFYQCYAEAIETTTETPKKEQTASDGVIITGIVLVSSFVVLIVLLPTIAIDKIKKAKEKANEAVTVRS